MIRNPFAICILLVAVEAFILYLSSHPRTQKYFSFLPHIFWIYFLPMVLSTIGLIDPQSPLYTYASQWILPMSLVILLLSVDVMSIVRLGPMALGMFLAGALGVGVGMVVAFGLFKGIIGGDYWSGFGALTGSWTGGSANMIAVKEALSAPDSVFLPLVVVDAILPYFWMGLLIMISSWQIPFDRWNHARREIAQDLEDKARQLKSSTKIARLTMPSLALIIVIGLAATALARALSAQLLVIKDVFSPFTWVIVIVSMIGLALSFSPVKRLEERGSTKIGYFLLYFVLTTIGAKANLNQMGESIVLLAAGALVIVIHALFLFVALRVFKAPLFLAAAASQANLGGVASAPVVAEVYQKGLAPLGLLLAIFGNIVGTYIGIITGQICRWLANVG